MQKVKDFYRSCLDTKSIETAGVEPFLTLVQQVRCLQGHGDVLFELCLLYLYVLTRIHHDLLSQETHGKYRNNNKIKERS